MSSSQAAVQRLAQALDRDHVPPQEQLLPSAGSSFTVKNGMLQPSYPTLSAPVGIGYYGIQNVGGKNVASISYYKSLQGDLTLNQLNLLYLQSAGPDEFTAQLNGVLTGVTVHGDPNLQFWTQNVIYYYQSSHALHLTSAIVNFSTPGFSFAPNTIIGGHGNIYPGFGYFYPEGPVLTVPEPFTLRFYANASVVNNMPAIYFNYSITKSNGHTISGSYDMVEFNATLNGVAHTPQARPAYQVNGEAFGGTGFIPNDAELMLGGDGGGSPATILNINGTMQLYTQTNSSKVYKPVPAAYSFGSETGETSDGIAEWASGGPNPTVHLGPGPSIQMPLWGVVGAPSFGHITANLHVSPSNAFIFASRGSSFDENTATWGPTPVDGAASYALPAGKYTFEVLLSEYNPVTLTVTGTSSRTVSLSSNPGLGVYTPLWAWDNGQLAAISEPGGAGTVSNPYVLFNTVTGLVNPLFGTFNDYEFPIFPGIQLVDTSAYVSIYRAPAFYVAYSLTWEAAFLGDSVPLANNLNLNFYGVEHVSIVAAPAISGWLFYANYATANLVLWNSSYNLIAGDSFQVASLAVLTYGGGHNVFWGNVFSTVVPTAPNPSLILDYGNPLALWEFESGDLIYNNAFETPQTAVSPSYDLYSFNGIPAVYKDLWNVVKQPASDVRVVNGWILSGSILGLSYEGGNYWSNYGTAADPYGVLPYDNGGAIAYRGDYVPLVPFALYTVTFTEKGLKAGTSWSVTIDGYTQTTTKTSMTFELPNGTVAFVVGAITGEHAHPAKGAIIVDGANVAVTIRWT